MSLSMWIPIAVIVASNICYHICSKSMPNDANPFAALTLTYLIGAAVSGVLFFAQTRGGNLLAEYKHLNWTSVLLGISIVGLEAGSIYMYKAGWNISSGQLVHSAILAICLIFIGMAMYNEHMTPSKIIGIVLCMAGLFFINR